MARGPHHRRWRYLGDAGFGAGQIEDPIDLSTPGGATRLDPDPAHNDTDHAVDGYTLSGPSWEWAWPDTSGGTLTLQLRNFALAVEIDLFRRVATAISRDETVLNRRFLREYSNDILMAGFADAGTLLRKDQSTFAIPASAYANLIVERRRLNTLALESVTDAYWTSETTTTSTAIVTLSPRSTRTPNCSRFRGPKRE